MKYIIFCLLLFSASIFASWPHGDYAALPTGSTPDSGRFTAVDSSNVWATSGVNHITVQIFAPANSNLIVIAEGKAFLSAPWSRVSWGNISIGGGTVSDSLTINQTTNYNALFELITNDIAYLRLKCPTWTAGYSKAWIKGKK